MRYILLVASVLWIVACNGGGDDNGGDQGGQQNLQQVTVQGHVDDGGQSTAIANAACRVETLDAARIDPPGAFSADANGDFDILVDPDVQGVVVCSPPGLEGLALRRYFSTVGLAAGGALTGQDVRPETTVVYLQLMAEREDNPNLDLNQRAGQLYAGIGADAPSPAVAVLIQVAAALYDGLLAQGLNTDFSNALFDVFRDGGLDNTTIEAGFRFDYNGAILPPIEAVQGLSVENAFDVTFPSTFVEAVELPACEFDDSGVPPLPGGGTLAPQTNIFVWNPEAVIPPQCYTKTEGVHNPCYTCHQNAHPGRPNRQNDGGLQGDYGFSELGFLNHWTNLFVDRREQVAAITDNEILEYIGQDNYSPLVQALNNCDFKGWIPDIKDLQKGAEAFDERGLATDGSWWVAFNYKPLPSTFWPTNGSTDDVMIRLPVNFWKDPNGNDSNDVYFANLAILEAAIKNVPTMRVTPIDENAFGVDLNGDQALGVIDNIQRPSTYVGLAANVDVVPYLYPEGVAFLHTVRYVGINANGEAETPARMKEVRYMEKVQFYDYATLAAFYDDELSGKIEGNLPIYSPQGDKGIYNNFGWNIQGFIEDGDGDLRPAIYEENLFCMGCHATIGATIDQTFAFPRKRDGAAGWGYLNVRGMPDAPTVGDEAMGEIARYLEVVGGGDEFRQNQEMIDKWFDENGQVDLAAVSAAEDVYTLIEPSRERALTLNKAYKVIVEEQSYIFGRDATVMPAVNVFPEILDPDDPNATPPLRPEARRQGNIFLDWSAVE